MSEELKGRQQPTTEIVFPYTKTYGKKAVELYNRTTRKARPWQAGLLYDILAVDDEGLYIHMKFGYEVPRRNGKGEIIAQRELFGLIAKGEKVMHTAHRTSTSHSAWERLCKLLDELGEDYKSTKQYGFEKITLPNGGEAHFRTRSTKGGLGEGFDLLIIDEAQEYTIDQESALQYVVSDSDNPQTLFCGTPPTAVSSGTVFMDMRKDALESHPEGVGWAEWSVSEMTDPNDREAWAYTNPSLGYGLKERSIVSEDKKNEIDFNIQRLGLWLKYNQKSAILEGEWDALKYQDYPQFTGKLFVGIKYGHDGKNVAMSIAVKTFDGRIYFEAIDCAPLRNGDAWIIAFLKQADVESIYIDGANGVTLQKELVEERIPANLMTVSQVIESNANFEQHLSKQDIIHNGQPSLRQVATNCEKRAIGTKGGFGFNAQKEEHEIALLDSAIIAVWSASNAKPHKRQSISY